MKEMIINLLKKALKEEGIELKKEVIDKFIETPPSLEMGDFSFPCFFLVDELKKEPHEIALGIRAKIGNIPIDLEDIQVSGPYINFFVDRKELARKLVREILTKKERFGRQKINLKGMVEFSQPNTHKAFHVGHIRGTSIGESLARIAEFFSEEVTRANYQGDTGMHVAKWLWCYQKYHPREKLKKDESWIASIYVDAMKRLTKNKRLYLEVQEINKRLDLRIDKNLNKLWRKTRKLSLDSLEKIYKELNTFFDVYYFESKLERQGKEIANKLVKDEIAKISEGATIIDLSKSNLSVWVLLRRDGTVLYPAKDLALAEKKFKDFKLDWSVYVVGNEQNLHVKQLFKVLELMKFKDIDKLSHVSYGLVKLPSGKMSSRTGENILYSDFINDITDYAKKRIKERSKKILKKDLEERSLAVSIAAIKYSMLKQSPNKDIIFRKEDALNFEGDTGSYLLYSYARASSILRKAKTKDKKLIIKELEPKEVELVKKLSKFPEVVLNSYNDFNPSLIANYSYQLAQLFNEFYHACPVIGSEQELFRLRLVESFRIVLKSSLNLLGIETLEKM